MTKFKLIVRSELYGNLTNLGNSRTEYRGLSYGRGYRALSYCRRLSYASHLALHTQQTFDPLKCERPPSTPSHYTVLVDVLASQQMEVGQWKHENITCPPTTSIHMTGVIFLRNLECMLRNNMLRYNLIRIPHRFVMPCIAILMKSTGLYLRAKKRHAQLR